MRSPPKPKDLLRQIAQSDTRLERASRDLAADPSPENRKAYEREAATNGQLRRVGVDRRRAM